MQKEIDLKVLFNIIRKRLLLILIVTSVITGAAALYASLSEGNPPVYQSFASILLNTNETDGASTYEVILRDPTVLENVIADLGLTITVKEINDKISFSNDGGAKIVKVYATDTNPELAARIASSTANIFIKQVGSILGIYDARILSEATPSNNPIVDGSTPSVIKFLVLGMGAGFILSIGFVLLIDSLDDSIKSEREIEKLLGKPVIGSIARMNKKNMKSVNWNK